MTETFKLPENVTNARANAENLTSVASQYAAAEPTVSDVLRQRVQEAYANNQDVIGPLDTATANYYSAPAQAREKYLTPGSANYLQNPFAAERMVSEYTNQQAVPMLSYGNILGQRMGRIQDLIGTGVNAWEAGKNAAMAKAEQARQTYQDSLNEYLQLQNLEMEQQKINKSGSGSGGAFDYAALAKLFGMGGEGGETVKQPSIEDALEEDDPLASLTDSEKVKALTLSATSNKTIQEIANEMIKERNKKPSAGIYDASGTPAANVDYGGLQYTGFQL